MPEVLRFSGSDHPQKIPASHKNDMIKMHNESLKTVKFDKNKAYKTLWAKNELRGSEYFFGQ